MKWMIASDLHGSRCWTEKLLAAFEREGAQRLLLLGDILYHGPRNDLPEGYEPRAVIALLSPLKDKLLCVRGNCDAEVDQMVLGVPILENYTVMDLGERLVCVTHGHSWNKDKRPPLCPGDILLHGHTHVPACEVFGEGNIYMNPGSVSLPKEGSHHGYMTLSDGLFLWKDMDGNVKKEYRV